MPKFADNFLHENSNETFLMIFKHCSIKASFKIPRFVPTHFLRPYSFSVQNCYFAPIYINRINLIKTTKNLRKFCRAKSEIFFRLTCNNKIKKIPRSFCHIVRVFKATHQAWEKTPYVVFPVLVVVQKLLILSNDHDIP